MSGKPLTFDEKTKKPSLVLVTEEDDEFEEFENEDWDHSAEEGEADVKQQWQDDWDVDEADDDFCHLCRKHSICCVVFTTIRPLIRAEMCKASSRSPLDLEARICVLHYLKLFAHRTLLFKMLPMIKVGGLIIRTLTKPLAKAVKTRSKMHPYLNQFCHAIGQQQHRYLIHLHMSFRGVPKFVVKDLPPDQAVEQGADLIGEIIIFSVAVAVASFEYHRSSLKAKTKEEIEQQQKQQAQEDMENRFQRLEAQFVWLEMQVAKIGQLLEKELNERIDAEASTDAIKP
ncbi:hypothetical protein ABG067_004107 [Albugo candida]